MVDMLRAPILRIRANPNSVSGRRYILTMLLYLFPLMKIFSPARDEEYEAGDTSGLVLD